MAASPPSALSERMLAAVAASNLRDLPTGILDRLADGATVRAIQPGGMLHTEGETRPHLELVVSGLVRVSVTALDGRTMTVRYCRPGALIGAVSLYGRDFVLPASIHALVASDVLVLLPSTVRRLVDTEPQVARALLAELSERVESFLAEIPRSAFATVRERVARHLLDLASVGTRDPRLVASVTQPQLAAACGTVREVVVRELRELRGRGLVATGHDGIEILDPGGLLALAAAGGTWWRQEQRSLTGGRGRRMLAS